VEYQDLVDTGFSPTVGDFKPVRTDTTKITVPAYGIVEVIDIFRQIEHGAISVSVDALFDTLLLQAAEEGFSNSIIPTVSSPAHARLKMISLVEAPLGITAVLRAPI
jgi:hypothetical protein